MEESSHSGRMMVRDEDGFLLVLPHFTHLLPLVSPSPSFLRMFRSRMGLLYIQNEEDEADGVSCDASLLSQVWRCSQSEFHSMKAGSRTNFLLNNVS